MSGVKTFLIIAAVVLAAIGIGYMAGGRNPGLYNKIEKIEDKAEARAKEVVGEAKDKSRKMFGRDKSKKLHKSGGEVVETDEIIIIRE
jgi:hypothetical protein